MKASLHFGSDQPVEEEHEAAMSKYKYAIVPGKALVTPAAHKDPFTCHIQETLAMVVFGENIPKEKPTKDNATDALLVDVEFYQRASERSQYFEQNLLMPTISELYEKMILLIKKHGNHQLLAFHNALKENVELIVEPIEDLVDGDNQSIWSCKPVGSLGRRLFIVNQNDSSVVYTVFATLEEATLLTAIHNNYHFKRYIQAIVASAMTARAVTKIEGFVSLWHELTGESATFPVREWNKKKRLYFTGPIYAMFEARRIAILISRL